MYSQDSVLIYIDKNNTVCKARYTKYSAVLKLRVFLVLREILKVPETLTSQYIERDKPMYVD